MKDVVTGFTCGSFDLLHAGHYMMLKYARDRCDRLIVGLQIDPTTDRKDKNKPIQSVHERWTMLRGCRYVDEIVIYHTECELVNLLKLLESEISFRFIGEDWKGGEYTGRSLGLNTIFVPRKHSYSSHNLRQRVYKEGIKLKEEKDYQSNPE